MHRSTHVYDQILHRQGTGQLGDLIAKLVYVLVEHVRNILLTAGLLGIAELRGILTRQETLISDQCHALIGYLVSFKMNLVVWTTCKRKPLS